MIMIRSNMSMIRSNMSIAPQAVKPQQTFQPEIVRILLPPLPPSSFLLLLLISHILTLGPMPRPPVRALALLRTVPIHLAARTSSVAPIPTTTTNRPFLLPGATGAIHLPRIRQHHPRTNDRRGTMCHQSTERENRLNRALFVIHVAHIPHISASVSLKDRRRFGRGITLSAQ